MIEEQAEQLEASREFLIRSLEDLEAERDAGNIDDETYERLHGDYTARAAAVLRTIDGERVATPAGPAPVPAGRRALVIGAIVAFAIAAAVVLAITISPRLPGQTVTGGVKSDPKAALAALQRAAREHPNDFGARIALARALLSSDPAGALEQYDAAARLKPTDPEPPTYIGWILGLSSQAVTKPSDHANLISRALSELADAHRIDPKYPDAYVFDGLVRFRFANRPKEAVPRLKKYLQLSPAGAQAAMVRSELAAAQKAAAAPAGAPTTTANG